MKSIFSTMLWTLSEYIPPFLNEFGLAALLKDFPLLKNFLNLNMNHDTQ